MQRREFLKLSGAGVGSAVLLTGLSRQLATLPVEAIFQGKLFRGFRNGGDIFVSEDAGKTWQLHARLGPQYSVDDLFVNAADHMQARVGFMQYQFQLSLSSDGNQWKTA